MTTTASELLEVLTLPRVQEQRVALRKLVTPTLVEWIGDYEPLQGDPTGQTPCQVLFNWCPIIGTGDDQLNIQRATITALRDYLSVEVLTGIAAGRISKERFFQCIVDPTAKGFRSTSARNKTGYELGRPEWYTETCHADVIEMVTSAAESEAEGVLHAEAMSDTELVEALLEPVHEQTKRPATVDVSAVPEAAMTAIDSLLKAAGQPTLEELNTTIEAQRSHLTAQSQRLTELHEEKSREPVAPATLALPSSETTIPEGTIESVKATELFDIPSHRAEGFGFRIPHFKWAGVHPMVPVVDENYIFRPELLQDTLLALAANKKVWYAGHTGTGKTTLIEQVAAHLNWPVIRVNFDSEITRMDLMGRDALRDGEHGSITEFIDGVLPQALAMPVILLCDELDFIRSDVSYVFQRALEDAGLLITEDGGRLVTAHPFFRLMATGNTKGQGDETGLYQAARPQSAALLDRFPHFLEVDYMHPDDEAAVMVAKVGDLFSDGVPSSIVSNTMAYVKEHREAFVQAQVLQPMSTRGVIEIGEAAVRYIKLGETDQDAFRMALKKCVLNRASSSDRVILMGVAQRTESF